MQKYRQLKDNLGLPREYGVVSNDYFTDNFHNKQKHHYKSLDFKDSEELSMNCYG